MKKRRSKKGEIDIKVVRLKKMLMQSVKHVFTILLFLIVEFSASIIIAYSPVISQIIFNITQFLYSTIIFIIILLIMLSLILYTARPRIVYIALYDATYGAITIIILIYVSVLTGISTALFLVHLIVLFPYETLIQRISIFLSSIFFALQLSFVIFFLKEISYLKGGSLAVVSFGILEFAMGVVLLLFRPQLENAIDFRDIAGPIIGSGLTLIAVGVQTYYNNQHN